MSIPDVLESMDRAGADNRRVADEEAEIRAALRAEVARAGSQRALAEEWRMSEQFLGKVINGRKRPTAKIRERIGFGPRPAAAPGTVHAGRHRSSKREKLFVKQRPPARPARPPRGWRYPLRPVVLNIFTIEKGLRRWASESAPGQIREREAAMAGATSSES